MSNHIFKKTISSILITVIFIVSIFSVFNIKTTHAETPAETAAARAAAAADPDVVGTLSAEDAVQLEQIKTKAAGISSINALGNNMVPTDDRKINQKEKILDSIWMLMAKRTIRHITVSTVNWINSGFQGNPAFVTDFGGFMRDIADEEIGRFIEGSALAFLCDPLDIKFSLMLKYAVPFEREVECTLSDVVGNIDDFVNGNFSSGGWDGWMELTTKPKNNRYGAYLASAAELEARIQFGQFEKGKVVEFGSGFLSYEKCDPPGSKNCEIVTPGSVIEKQLETVLGSGVRQLELADEFNEIVNALMSQLIVRVFNSANDGLRGLSDESSGRRSYTSRLSTTEDTATIQNVITNSEIEFGRVINEELVYLTSKQGTLGSFTDAETQLASLIACYDNKLADNSLSLTTAERALATERRNNASTTIDTFITPRKDTLISEINTESAIIIRLDSLLTDIQNSTNPNQLQVPTNELESMRRQNLLRGSDILLAEQERLAALGEMGSLNGTTNAQITECQAFPPPPIPIVQNP